MTRLPVVKTYKLYVGGAFGRSESGRHVSHGGILAPESGVLCHVIDYPAACPAAT